MSNLAFPPSTAAADMIVALRALVGQGTSTEVFTDADATRCLTQALWEINRYKPLWTLGSFATVASKQKYTPAEVNIPADAVYPIKIFWGANGTGGGNIGYSALPAFSGPNWILADFLNNAGRATRIDPAAVDIAARNYGYFQHFFGGKGMQLRDGNVWLDPMPSGVQTVWYFSRGPRFAAYTSVTQEYVEALMANAEYRACLMLALKQSEVARAQIGFGKNVTTMGGAVYMQAAKMAEAKFHDLLRSPTKIYTV